MYEEILIATDGSDYAAAAADHGIELARLSGGRVHAVYVIETRTAYDNAIVDPETVTENLRTDGREAIEAVATAAEKAGVEAETELLEGIPAEELVAYVEKQDIDVIVAGERGKSDFKRALLGSTTERLLNEAKAPVFVVSEKRA